MDWNIKVKTILKEKENIVCELMGKNNELEIDKQSNLGKINMLNVRIQELNEKIISFEKFIEFIRRKLNCEKTEWDITKSGTNIKRDKNE